MLFLIFPCFSRPFFLGKAWEVHESKMATFPESFAHLIWKCMSWMWSSLIKLNFTFTLCACVFRSASDALVCLHNMLDIAVRSGLNFPPTRTFVGLCKRFQNSSYSHLSSVLAFSRKPLRDKGTVTGIRDCEDKTTVVVKSLLSDDERAREEFNYEMNALRGLQHKNVITLLGFCNEVEPTYLIFESVNKVCIFQLTLTNWSKGKQTLSVCTFASLTSISQCWLLAH